MAHEWETIMHRFFSIWFYYRIMALVVDSKSPRLSHFSKFYSLLMASSIQFTECTANGMQCDEFAHQFLMLLKTHARLSSLLSLSLSLSHTSTQTEWTSSNFLSFYCYILATSLKLLHIETGCWRVTIRIKSFTKWNIQRNRPKKVREYKRLSSVVSKKQGRRIIAEQVWNRDEETL